MLFPYSEVICALRLMNFVIYIYTRRRQMTSGKSIGENSKNGYKKVEARIDSRNQAYLLQRPHLTLKVE